ncbi:hypothetical protein G6F31_020973 [Rhizopus arrhizus]|nr:hypothetical protein G6F31_020973 [Rhizopus arrhizus]
MLRLTVLPSPSSVEDATGFSVVRPGWVANPAMPPPPPTLCATMPCEFVPAVYRLPPTSCVTVTVPAAPRIGEFAPKVTFAAFATGVTPLSIVTRPPPPPMLCASTPKDRAP